MTTADDKERAAQLKEEGNKLFVEKKYALASKKYTEALLLDDTNAILYANRAACRTVLREFLDACTDAQKAVQLDPTYAKAYARLAAAHEGLGNHEKCVDAWQKALDLLTAKKNLTPAEVKQRSQYRTGLSAAKAALKEATKPMKPSIVYGKGTKMPWVIAKEMIPELSANQTFASSAWVIAGAYEEFSEGIQMMKSLRKVPTGQGMALHGHQGAISLISNGIMRDERVFHIDDPNWITMYNQQVQLEVMTHKAWTEGGPDAVKECAKERLKQGGWDAARPALASTVRGWMMRGFIEGNMRGRHDVEVEFLSRAIEIINWGRTIWKSVSKDDRGVIFEETFLFGMRKMYLDAYVSAYNESKKSKTKLPLEPFYEEAVDFIRDLDAYCAVPGAQVDPGFIHSFIIYPKARAYSVKGFYHREMGILAAKRGDKEGHLDHKRQAAEAYLEAADLLPENEESHAWFLSCAVTNKFDCGTPLRVTLPILERIRLTIPKMRKIWVNSAMAKQSRDQRLDGYLEMETSIREEIKNRKFTLDDKVCPKLE